MDTFVKKILSAWNDRRVAVQSQGLSAFRLIFAEGDSFPGLTVDDFAGDFLVLVKDPRWVQRQDELQAGLLRAGEEIHPETEVRFFCGENTTKTGFRWLTSGSKTKIVTESDLGFEVALGKTQHPGLFLDQRDNRRRIRAWAKGKKVLNLFCHTGAFTVAALKGGAREAHSVDLSRNYLSALTRNVELNVLPAALSKTYAEDAFLFLKKKKDTFDLIIVDPPTFSRGKSGEFSTEQDLESLLGAAAARLAPKGRILASINTQSVSTASFLKRVKAAMQAFGLKVLEHYPLPFDFPLPEKKDPYLKSCLIG
jgi:23S rRNA (cytosine1962-C5)-methyltransferase